MTATGIQSRKLVFLQIQVKGQTRIPVTSEDDLSGSKFVTFKIREIFVLSKTVRKFYFTIINGCMVSCRFQITFYRMGL